MWHNVNNDSTKYERKVNWQRAQCSRDDVRKRVVCQVAHGVMVAVTRLLAASGDGKLITQWYW